MAVYFMPLYRRDLLLMFAWQVRCHRKCDIFIRAIPGKKKWGGGVTGRKPIKIWGEGGDHVFRLGGRGFRGIWIWGEGNFGIYI